MPDEQDSYYPPVSFYFSLSFGGIDAAFQEVSGISKELAFEEVASGGENRFKYKLPTGAKSQNLVLKRGLIAQGSALIEWCAASIGEGLTGKIETKDLSVNLLNASGEACACWTFYKAYPVKYSISDLNSLKSELVIESIELAYTYFTASSGSHP